MHEEVNQRVVSLGIVSISSISYISEKYLLSFLSDKMIFLPFPKKMSLILFPIEFATDYITVFVFLWSNCGQNGKTAF